MATKKSTSGSKGRSKVHKVMKEHKEGTEIGQRKESQKSQTGGGDRPERSAEIWCKDSQEEKDVLTGRTCTPQQFGPD